MCWMKEGVALSNLRIFDAVQNRVHLADRPGIAIIVLSKE